MPPLSRLAATALLLSAGFGAGYSLSTLSERKVEEAASQKTSSTKPLKERSFEEVMATGDPRESLQWLALYPSKRTNADFEAALRQLAGQGRSDKAFGELLFQWAEHDPLAALAYGKEFSAFTQMQLLPSLFEGWAQKDYTSLAQWLGGDDGQNATPILRALAIRALSARDPNLAFSHLSSRETMYGAMELHFLFHSLAKNDPRAALLLLDKLSAEKKQQATNTLLSAWAEHDPEAALSWAKSREGRDRAMAIRSIIFNLTEQSPEKTAALLASEIDSISKIDGWSIESSFGTLFTRWLTEDPEKAKAWIETLPEEHRNTARASYEQAFARAKPREFLLGLEAGKSLSKDDERLLQMSLSNLARSHSAEAAAWLDKNKTWLPAGKFPDLVSALLSQTPDLSPRFLPLMRKGEMANSTYRSAGEKWASKDPAKAASYLSTLPPGEERDAFHKGVFLNTAKTDLNEAYRQAEATPGGSLQNAFLTTIAQQSKDHLETAEWLSSRFPPDSQGAAFALSSLVGQWANAAPEQTAAWLQKASPGDNKDRLISTFSSTIVDRDPDMAIQWAATIGNDGSRSSAMQNIARQWLRLDRHAAQEWIQTAPFTDKEKAALLK